MLFLKSPARWLIPLSLFLLSLSLWIPFGLNTGFWADGWPSLVAVQTRGIDFTYSPLTRPLLYLPWWAGYYLTPQSLVGPNLVVLFSILGKGLLAYGIWRKLGAAGYVAFVAAAITMVFPVDSALFNMGALAIHFALLAYLCAVYCLITYYLDGSRRWLIPMALGLIITVGIYETVYPLLVFTPALLLVLRKPDRRFLIASALWYAIPLLNGLRLLLLFTTSSTSFDYQSNLLSDTFSIAPLLEGAINNYRKHFVDVWVLTDKPVPTEHVLIGVVAGILLAAVSLFLYFRSTLTVQTTSKRYWILAVFGFLVIGLGFAAYLPTALRDSTQRTFYYSSVGAALVHVCLLYLVTRRFPFGPFIFCIVSGVLIGIGTIRMLDQHQVYVSHFKAQQVQARGLLGNVGNVPSGTGILVIDESPHSGLRDVYVGSSFYFNAVIGYAFGDNTIKGGLCYPNEVEPWGNFRETCTFSDTGAVVTLRSVLNMIDHEYDHLIALRYTVEDGFVVITDLSPYVSGGQPDDYNPAALSDFSPPFPPRFLNVFGVMP
jgi:hypothetical protein